MSQQTILGSWKWIAALTLLVSFAVRADAADSRPNIVIILADDQGWGDLSVHGNTNISTPHIDSLARDGAIFDRFFVCPVCAPTRGELLTGRYHPRGGVRGVSTGQERLNYNERTIADVFRAAGYATGAFGKWHNGMQAPYHPNHRGFDEYYGFCSGHWGDYFSPPLEHNGQRVQGDGYITDDLTNHAIAFIEANRQQSFFCYLPYCTPHSPMQVPDAYWDRFADKQLGKLHRDPDREEIPKTRAALAMCENIDWNVGRVLAKLDELKLAENTIVLYFSDNGPNSYRWNDDMKGRKGSHDEGGVRVPMLMRWPGKIAAGKKVTQIAGAIDLLPTLAELANVNVPAIADKPLDGKSLKPLLTGDNATWPERLYYNFYRGKVSVRSQRYRLDTSGKLFDMVADPGQRRDVAKEHPQIASQMHTAAQAMLQEVKSDWGKDERPFTVGFAKLTPLPARDGVPHGKIQRSAGAPNCSFFTNWKSTDDRITWDVEVKESGRFRATLLYT
ncbi:MAG: arylsulfatase, partial [Planctomycetales bacterium]|nr:arylsulfatase [Planctomycetales bacterium]